MHISKVDLNLFTVFEAIYTEGSVTRASQKLFLTQPAISHALNRLRVIFEDPLFTRQGHAMVSTPLARSIIEPVRQALRGLEVTLADAGKFDAMLANKQFNLALRDVLESTVLPPLLKNITEQAPQVSPRGDSGRAPRTRQRTCCREALIWRLICYYPYRMKFAVKK